MSSGVTDGLGPYSLPIVAADVGADGSVTVYDALAVLKTAIGLPVTNQPRWVFVDADQDYAALAKSNVTYTAGIADVSNALDAIDFTAVLLGDVDASADLAII